MGGTFWDCAKPGHSCRKRYRERYRDIEKKVFGTCTLDVKEDLFCEEELAKVLKGLKIIRL